MKQKEHYLMFFLFLFLATTFSNVNSIDASPKKTSELAKLKEMFAKRTARNLKIQIRKLKNKPIYWKGWIKYFHYTESKKISKPKSFFQNNNYYRQRIKHSEKNNKDKYGLINIPSNVHYFAIIQKDKMNILSSRSDEIPNIVDTLNYEFIKPIPMNDPTKGGINDLGNFPEGKCIKVSTNIPKSYQKNFNPSKKGYSEAWIICTDIQKDKIKILKYLINLTVRIQQKNGLTYKTQKKNFKHSKGKKTLAQIINPNLKKKNKKNKNSTKPKDGYWILLQDWTQCTLKCGGGKKYQQWMCHPPENGGRPCMGDAIRVKDCNKQPCPKILSKQKIDSKGRKVKTDGKGNTSVTLKPIVKILPFSVRPQRYTKCVIKENDAMFVLKNYKHYLPKPQGDQVPKIPVRLVMNNSTISGFQDENYHNNIFTVNIKETSFLRDKKEKCCFLLRWRKSEYKLCGFERDCKVIKETTTSFVEDWSKDFNLFRNDCSVKRDIFSFSNLRPKVDIKTGKITLEAAPSSSSTSVPGTVAEVTTSTLSSSSSSMVQFDENGKIKPGSVSLPITRTDQKSFQNTLIDLVQQARDKLIAKKGKIIEQRVANFEQETLQAQVRHTQSMALNAIKREMELEELVQKEEQAKEAQDTQTIMKQIIMEKRKEECLKRAMKEKEQESQVTKEKAQAMSEIERIKKEALKTLTKKRMELKKKIIRMRRVAQRKKAMLKFQLIKLRQRMAKRLVISHHKGNMFLCPQGRDDPTKRNDYCEFHFSEDYPKFLECKNDYDFCFLCCETEYGNLFPQKREECYRLCDKK